MPRSPAGNLEMDKGIDAILKMGQKRQGIEEKKT
jgi:hypothetical protein